MVEIGPDDPELRSRKHLALGRFRYENLTLRGAPGTRLGAHVGDDYRGRNIWKQGKQ